MRTKKQQPQTTALFEVDKKQQPKKKDWQDSSKELRIRNFSEKHKAQLKEIMKLTKKPFESYAVEYLIENYVGDQSLIKQLQQRNSQLHATVNRLVERETGIAAFIKSFQEFMKIEGGVFKTFFASSLKKSIRLSKEFKKAGTVKSTSSKPGASSRTKTVPKKKGGKK